VDHPTLDDAVAAARHLVDEAERIVVLTGAGISTDSGIPDFRGPQGIWTKNPEAEKQATLSHYVGDPEIRKRVWRSRLESHGQERRPNPGHLALFALEQRAKLHTLVTQNVDGLHHAAGHDPALIVEVHGHMREVKCLGCGERAPMARALDRVRAGEDDPPCRTCGGILKSATVAFGENLDPRDIERMERAALTCDLVLAAGTTLGVYPAAGMVPIAARNGASIVIVNGEPTEMDSLARVVVRGSLSEVLPEICGAGLM
jgi:NAD-dependent deacetylase